jgi:hypothetical protein
MRESYRTPRVVPVLLKQSEGHYNHPAACESPGSPRAREMPPPPPIRSTTLFGYRGGAANRTPPRSSSARVSSKQLLPFTASACTLQLQSSSSVDIITSEPSLRPARASHAPPQPLQPPQDGNAESPADGVESSAALHRLGAIVASNTLPPRVPGGAAWPSRPSARATLLERFDGVNLLARHLGVSKDDAAARLVSPVVAASIV